MLALIVAISVICIFLYGFLMMKRIDAFFNNAAKQKCLLRIGMDYPGMEAAVKYELDVLLQDYPNLDIILFSGKEEILKQSLKDRKIDFIITFSKPDNKKCTYISKPLVVSSVTSNQTGLPITSLREKTTSYVIWITKDCSSICDFFASLLKASEIS